MAASKSTTVVSTKGQVILPKPIRQRRRWNAGTRLVVEETPEGVLLRADRHFPATEPAEVFASLPSKGPVKTIDEMKAGVLAEARRRHARD